MKRFEQIIRKKPGLYSVLLSMLCFAVLRLCTNLFIQVDDILIANGVSGGYDGVPQQFPFISATFADILASLYRIFPGVSWYTVFMELLLIFSCAGIHYCILISAFKRDLPCWVAEAAFGAMFFMMLLTMSIPISFTLVAGICGLAASLLLFSVSFSEKVGCSEMIRLLFSAVLLYCSALIRNDCFLVDACFYALTSLFAAVSFTRTKHETAVKKPLRFSVLILAFMLVTIVGGIVTGNVIRKSLNQENIEWNNGRSWHMDYAVPKYEDAKEIYNSAGWYEGQYKLAHNYYYSDEAFSHDTLTTLNAALKKSSPEKTVSTMLKKTAATVFGAFSNLWQIGFAVFSAFSLILFVLCLARKRLNWQEILFAVCALGGMVLMWLYLSYRGRFTFHVFRLTTIQAFGLIFALCFLRFPIQIPKTFHRCNGAWLTIVAFYVSLFAAYALVYHTDSRIVKLIFFAGCIGLFVTVLLFALFLYRRSARLRSLLLVGIFGLCCILPAEVFMYSIAADFSTWRDAADRGVALEQYADEHNDKVFVMSTNNYSRITSFARKTEAPVNLFCALDYLRYTDAYYHKLSLNGMDELTVDMYLTDKVFYLGDAENDKVLPILLECLQTKYGDSVAVEIYDELENGAAVFRFYK